MRHHSIESREIIFFTGTLSFNSLIFLIFLSDVTRQQVCISLSHNVVSDSHKIPCNNNALVYLLIRVSSRVMLLGIILAFLVRVKIQHLENLIFRDMAKAVVNHFYANCKLGDDSYEQCCLISNSVICLYIIVVWPMLFSLIFADV